MSDDEGMQGAGTRPTAFLSYSHADQDRVRLLASALEQTGINVWWDTQIEGGAVFSKSVEVALARCDVVIVAWSKVSVSSDWVLDEASQGRDMRKLVPVSLDGTMPPLGFRQYLSVDLLGWRGDASATQIATIVRGVEAIAGRPIEAAAYQGKLHAPGSPPQARMTRRAMLLVAGGTALAGAAAIFAWRSGRHGGGLTPAADNSVAVLPFKNISGDTSQDYFSDGLSEELRSTLARNLKLQVMAQASSAKFRDRTEDAVTIASRLGVAYLLDGTVRKSGEIARITADLIDGRTGFSRWSQSFDRSLHDIFAVQSEIARTVASALAAEMVPDPQVPAGSAGALAAEGGTRNADAYDAYLRGRALYDLSVDESSERAALAQFDKAIAIDPDFAPAHAARARSLTTIANQYGKAGQLQDLYASAIESAQRAIEIAPGLADAYSTLGFTLFQGRLDARAAREPFERSRELGAGEATVLARYAQYCARVGRKREAAESIQRALLLDKLNPLIHRAAGAIEYAARNYAASIPPARLALQMNPRMSRAHAAIGDALFMLGRYDEARTEYLAEPASDFGLTGLAVVEHKLGHAQAARDALAKIEREGDRVRYQQAQILSQRGQLDAAIERLQQARAIGDSGLVYARNDPWLDPLRSDPRFAGLLKSIGFE
ncbi:MAG: TIR domain-containing protein [Gammaproteobacteria bacterium]|nr:TIR domain-containing protein [Gammaproteobacteria bacterium]